MILIEDKYQQNPSVYIAAFLTLLQNLLCFDTQINGVSTTPLDL